MKKKIIAYKGFDKDMQCRGMQYEEGQTYKMDDKPRVCDKGFHACENPIDCLSYYSIGEGSVYHEVEILGDIDRDKEADDTKITTNEIKIGAKLSIKQIVDLTIDFVYKHCKKRWKGLEQEKQQLDSEQHRIQVSSEQHRIQFSSEQHRRQVSSEQHRIQFSSEQHRRQFSSEQHRRQVSSEQHRRQFSSKATREKRYSKLIRN